MQVFTNILTIEMQLSWKWQNMILCYFGVAKWSYK